MNASPPPAREMRVRKRPADGGGGNDHAASRPRLSRDGSGLQVASLCRNSSSNSNVSSVASPRPASRQAWAGAEKKAEVVCSLISCAKPIDCKAARASIRIAPGEAKQLKSKEEKALIAWRGDGTATMHKECFELAKASAGMAKKKPFVFGQYEKGTVSKACRFAEVFDSEEDIIAKAHSLADAIVAAKHVCVFSGAGLSTAAGIGDYRGLKGKWTEEGMGENAHVEGEEEVEDDGGVSYENLRPTLAHEGISYLVSQGLVKYVISQNCDGLHLLSGVPEDKISELHGNVFREYCEKCGKEYERGQYVCFDDDLYYEELEEHGKTKLKKPKGTEQCKSCGLNHRTTRKCDDKKCNGPLRDTIINFGDDLRDHIWDPAQENADACDLMIAFGSTLEVTPACHLAAGPQQNSKRKKTKKDAEEQVRGYTSASARPCPVLTSRMEVPARKLAIINRQRTPLDASSERVGLRCHGDCDVVMRHVLLKLMGASKFEAWVAECEAKKAGYEVKRPRV